MTIKGMYDKARKNLLERIRYATKKGIDFAKSLIPAIPKRPTMASIERLNKMDAAYISAHAATKPGETPAKESPRKVKESPRKAKESPRKVKESPRKTKEFQDAYKREANRIRRYIKEQAKKGFIIDYMPAETPEHISPAKLRELKELTPKKLKARYGYKKDAQSGELVEIQRPLKGTLAQRVKMMEKREFLTNGETAERRRKNLERINAEAAKRERRNAMKRESAKAKSAGGIKTVSAAGGQEGEKTLAQRYLADVQKAESLRTAIAAAKASEQSTGIVMPEVYYSALQNELEGVLTEMGNIFPNNLSGNDALVAVIRELPDYESQVQALERALGSPFKKGIAERDTDFIRRAILELRTRGFEDPGAYRPKMSPLKHMQDLADVVVKNGGRTLESLSDGEREEIDAMFHPHERITADSIMERIQGAKDVFYKDDGITPKSQFIPELVANDAKMYRKIIEMGQEERRRFSAWVDEMVTLQRAEKTRLEKSKREIQREKRLHVFDDVDAVTDRLNDMISMIDDEDAREQVMELKRIWQHTIDKYSDDAVRKYISENEYDLFSSLDDVIDVQEIYRFLVMESGLDGVTAWEEALRLSRAAKLLNMNQPLPLSDGLKKTLAPRTKSRWDDILDEGNYKGLFSTYSIDTNAIRNIARRAGVVLMMETEESFDEWKDGYLNYSMEQKRRFGEEYGRDMNNVLKRMDDEVRHGQLTEKTQREFNMLTDFLMNA